MRVSVVLGSMVLVACGPAALPAPETTWVDVPNAHARFFTIQKQGALERAVVFGPDGPGDTIAIIPFANQPWERVAIMSTTHVPFITALGLTDRIVAAAHLKEVRDTSLLKRIAGQRVAELVNGERLDREQLMAQRPDVLFDQPFGRSDLAPQTEGIIAVQVTEYLEEHPLGRAEWIRFFGALLGKAELADQQFNAIVARYEQARQLVVGISSRPTVFFGSAWQGRFHGAAGNSYMVRALLDAGGAPWVRDPDGRENPPVDLEQMLSIADTIDHVGLVVALNSPPDARALMGGDERLAHLQGIARGGFYANSVTSDVFGQALLEPDVMLLDLIRILHPEHAQDHTPRYFHRIAQ